MIGWQEQHAVVTGGGSGIGAAIAAQLAGVGARVTIMGRDVEKLAAKAHELGIDYATADVTDRSQLADAFADAVGKNGTVSILINNAGVADSAPFVRMDDEHWDSTIAVNLGGVYNCTKVVIAPMLEAGAGRIINIASTAGLKGYAYVSAYSAAKHGVIGLTRSLALEYATKGVTVNAVCPGYTDTEIVRSAIEKIAASTGRSEEEARAELLKANPQGRLVKPEEVAATVLWLCEQDLVNGQAIAIDGGETI